MSAVAFLAAAVAAFAVGWVLGGIATNARRRRIVKVQVGALTGWRQQSHDPPRVRTDRRVNTVLPTRQTTTKEQP